MKGKSTLFRRIAVGLLVGAFAVPVAQAAQRPDDRSGPFGAAPGASTATTAVRPDDRAGPLGIGQNSVLSPVAAVRPDDRAGIRGVGPSEPALPSLRPDDRAGPLGIGAVEVPVVTSGDGFDWGDAGIGLAAGLGIALTLAGGLLLISHRIPRWRKIGATAAG